MKRVRVAAHAKVNLTLDVLGRRPDGYHEVRSVMARVTLADEVRVRRARRWHIAIHPPIGERPDLAERAARELARLASRDDAAAISIRKRIPLASGLGGGSSDAAHVLLALARLWDVDATLVREIAARVGSDVSFFLHGAIAEVGGRGERVRALRGGPWWGVLAFGTEAIATADAFARLRSASWSDGARSGRLVAALDAGGVDAAALRELCGNDLEAAAVSLCPAIGVVRERMRPTPLFLSGSGPTLYAIADDRGAALGIRRRLRRLGTRARVVEIAVPAGKVADLDHDRSRP